MAEKSKEFGVRLDGLIKNKGLSQKKLAVLVGIKQPTISSYINDGRIPEAPILYRLAQEFGVSMEFLLTGEVAPGTAPIKIITKEDKEIIDFLEKAEYVLRSKTRHANSLKENILSFHEAVTEKEAWQKKSNLENPGGAKSSPNKAM